MFNEPLVELVGVITQPDKPKGRGRRTLPSSIKKKCGSLSVQVFQPATKHEFSDMIHTLAPDLIIVIAYGMIIPSSVTQHYMCINAHASLLPLYRGPSPIHAALLNGDSTSGVTLIRMDEEMDHGDIISIESCTVHPQDTFKDLHDRLAALSASLIQTSVHSFFKDGDLNSIPQDHSLATYCHKLTTSDREILTEDSSEIAFRKIKTFSPYPGAFIQLPSLRLGIVDAEFKDQVIYLLTVKPEGKSTMTFSDFKRGHRDSVLDSRFFA